MRNAQNEETVSGLRLIAAIPRFTSDSLMRSR
jgi:hypothetical protein